MRDTKGRYTVSYKQRLVPLYLLIITFTASLTVKLGSVQAEGVVTAEVAAEAGQTEVTRAITPTPSPTPTEKELIIQKIVEVFGEDAPNAIKIAECESQFNLDTVGDTHIMSYHSGELVGDSIGIFQIRTGGSDFNRAKANGMTADEFRAEMRDPIKNIKYAKTIYDNRGWYAWYNCMMKMGISNE